MTDKRDNDQDPKKDNPENHSGDQHDDVTHDPSRRRFLKNSGMVAGGVIGGGLLGGFLTNQFTSNEEAKTPKTQSKKENTADYQNARQFFHRIEDFTVLEAAVERIYPKDDNGPGAIELGVPYFIDNQLAGLWGINGRDYRHRPFIYQKKNLSNEGQADQSMLDRGQIFLNGLRKMNDESKKRFDTTFDKADEDQQIEILQDFEHNKVKMQGVSAADFFTLLRQATLEGCYADPLYGGNKNMDGWRMKEFPGSQPSYTNIISNEKFDKIEPMSLKQYQGH